MGLKLVTLFIVVNATAQVSHDWVPCCSRGNGKVPRILPHPSDCRSFLVCIRNEPRQYFCPEGKTFNVRTQSCNWKKQECTGDNKKNMYEDCSKNAFETCPEVNGADVVMFPHPVDCGLYYVCDHGTAYPRPCPAGLHYNKALRTCDFPYRANCTARFILQKEPK